MVVTQLEPDLLKHLRVQFGGHGDRAVEYLETARRLLGPESIELPRLGELVAYCIREALKEIPKASGVSPDREWSRLSREVVNTFEKYESAVQLADDSGREALSNHRAAIRELSDFHKTRQGVHQKRLVSLMIQRAGVEPLRSGTAPVEAYLQLIKAADNAAHSRCSVARARELWESAVALLRQLFLPHELRNERLVQLARLEEPTETDLDKVLGLMGTSVHIKRFLREVVSVRWLSMFARSGALGEPGSDLWWAACSASVRLAETHRVEAESWLIALHDAHPHVVEHARCVAHAAQRIGGRVLDLLLGIVWRFPRDDRIVQSGVIAAEEFEPSHPMVQYLAFILLGEDSWDHVVIADELASRLTDGVNSQNALGRIALACRKLSGLSQDDDALGRFEYESSGLIAEAHTFFPHERSSVLLGCLTAMLRRAWGWHPPETLLDAASILQPALRDRLRAWVLASTPEAEPDALAAEVEQGIIGRDATGDDIALIDRAVEACGLDGVKDRWEDALGPAPSVAEVSRALGSDDVTALRDWLRIWAWVAVLPAEIAENWAKPCRVLAGRFGEFTRDDLLKGSTVESYGFESPYSAEELNSLSPIQAAHKIARWRPDHDSSRVSALYLARALEESIKHDPSRWLVDPLGVATALRHPVHISHYLGAARDCPGVAALHLDGLLDVIALVEGEPWPAEDLNDRAVKYPSWRDAKQAAVGLIAALIKADVTFGGRADEVWNYLCAAARDLSLPPWEARGSRRTSDPVFRAINRTSTRALETAVLFAARELSAERPLRPELEELLGFALRLEGADGAEYRSILASNFPRLRRMMPEWTQANLGLIYGPDAPDDLGQLTFRVTIEQGSVDDWLREMYPDELKDAAASGIPYALNHVLAGMLRRCAGYEPESVATYLRQHPDVGQHASASLAFLLGRDGIQEEHLAIGEKLWRALIRDAPEDILTGFGRMFQVTALDDDRWAKLTLDTLSATAGQIDWHNQVADRAMNAPVTINKLTIVLQIVQGQSDPWALRRVADGIEEFLDAASEFEDTEEYARLRTALQERDLID
ncbi:hypothetical protein [Candidatus Poriferisodalis sp.]|uniref:hypothetical protein n=1 Tax=Candidatus Poriferisodalis sp. TaxID=3101277 RepID=UPI003B01CEBD